MNKIKHYRMTAGLTQEDLGRLSKVGGQSTVANYEAGVRTPDLKACRAITSVFHDYGLSVSIDDVFPPTESDAA